LIHFYKRMNHSEFVELSEPKSTAHDKGSESASEVIKHVTISEAITPNRKISSYDRENDSDINIIEYSDQKEIKKEIVGILKPSSVRREPRAFPSLKESFLQDLGLQDSMSLNSGKLTEKEVEEKFATLSLIFKTDQLTLNERIELQRRQRDLAERNVTDEIRQLYTAVKSLNRLCSTSDSRDVLERLDKQVSVLQQSSNRVCSSAEQYGAVQQELRVSKAIHVMLLHVENLRRNYEKECHDLEESRKVLREHKKYPDHSNGQPNEKEDNCNQNLPRRSTSVAQKRSTTEQGKRRRVTLATPPHKNIIETKDVDTNDLDSLKKDTLQREEDEIKTDYVKDDNCLTVNTFNTSECSPISENGEDDLGNGDETTNETDSNNNEVTDQFQNANVKESPRYRKTTNKSTLKEIEDLEKKRDISPIHVPHISPNIFCEAKNLVSRRKSLMVHLSNWYSDLYWPYTEEETILGIRYTVSGLLLLAAAIVLVTTFTQ